MAHLKISQFCIFAVFLQIGQEKYEYIENNLHRMVKRTQNGNTYIRLIIPKKKERNYDFT